MRFLAALLFLACCFSASASAANEPAYINYDRGWVRDPYAGPMGEKETFGSVESAIGVVSSANNFEGQAIGYSHQLSSLYAAYEYLAEEASEDQLLNLLKSKNPVSRCYSVMALTGKLSEDQVSQYSSELVHDHEEFSTLHYDMGGSSTVADCMIESWYSKMTREDRDGIATYLLTEKPRLTSMQQLLFFWDLSDEHYSLIRNLLDNDVRLAPVALAGFQRELDLPDLREVIAKDDFLAMHIISRFPHESFLPIVREMLDEEIRKSSFINNLDRVFGALLAYPETVVMKVLSPYVDGDKEGIEDLAEKASSLFYILGRFPPDEHLDLRLKLFGKWHNH